MASLQAALIRISKRQIKYVRCITRTFASASKSPNEAEETSINNNPRPDSWCQFYDRYLLFQFHFPHRPMQEPIKSTSILLFPGQGAQFVGMARNLLDVPGVKDMFDAASSMLRTNLLKTCLEGPSGKLKQNIHCQPALYVTSLAAVKKLKMESPEVCTSFLTKIQVIEKCVAAAGYSIGEISALVFAGVYTFEEGKFNSCTTLTPMPL